MAQVTAKLTQEYEPKVPTGLAKVLAAAPKAKALWGSLTPIARRDFISWIESAKQAETRERRIAQVPSMLTSGKRRPCCYALLPMNLYKALAGTANTKATWSSLSPTQRRDFVSWIESTKEKKARRARVEKACLILAGGKQHP